VPETRYIVVEGPIGVGKTSLARRLADAFACQLVEELPDTNPFLERFYAEAGRSALATQLRFLLDRYRQQQALPSSRDGHGVVADYLFAKDQIFAELNLEGPELILYRDVLGLMTDPIATPDLVIYLEARPDVLMRRLRSATGSSSGVSQPRISKA
jgi:deoxyguanosine kinase